MIFYKSRGNYSLKILIVGKIHVIETPTSRHAFRTARARPWVCVEAHAAACGSTHKGGRKGPTARAQMRAAMCAWGPAGLTRCCDAHSYAQTLHRAQLCTDAASRTWGLAGPHCTRSSCTCCCSVRGLGVGPTPDFRAWAPARGGAFLARVGPLWESCFYVILLLFFRTGTSARAGAFLRGWVFCARVAPT